MTIHKNGLVAICIVLLAGAGCRQEQVTAPAPSFEPPTVRLPKPVPIPGSDGQVTSGATDQTSIKQVKPDQILSGAALTPAVKARAWKYIVIHHSDTPFGSAARFHRAHLARGWDALGYDFVIGNGTETQPDGLIEVGPRWTKQMDGAHTGTPDQKYNMGGIGICLVGNFENSPPTAAQMDSLIRLTAYMMKTYNIPAGNVIGHRDAKPTGCPGQYLYSRLPEIRRKASDLAQNGQ